MEDVASKPNLFNVRSRLEDEDKEKLERIYGVRIVRNALSLCCRIARIYFDDGEKSVESREALLKSKAADLLEKACVTLRSQLDGQVGEDEKSFDEDEYKLVRTFVESRESAKEKHPDHKIWFRHLQRELHDLTDKPDCFFKKWKPLLKKKHKRSPQRLEQEIELLQRLCQELTFCLPNNGIHTALWNRMIKKLDVLIALDSKGFHKKFEEFITVGPDLIAKVASSLTGVPASWLLGSSSRPRLDDLVTRLSRRQFGKRLSILTISNALSRAPDPGPLGRATRPLALFLFICSPRHGGPELAQALAAELFDGQGSLTQFDLSEYTSSDSVSRLLGAPISHGELGSSGELTEAVERNPFSIVLFSNIDVAHISVVDMLTEVSRRGRLTNGQGRTIDFTKTLIIMTLAIGINKGVSFACDCFHIVENGDCPIKELLNRYTVESKHRCSILSHLEEVNVQKQLKQELFEQLDDIVIFSGLRTEYSKAIARMQLRDIASSMTTRGLIIYISEAAVEEVLLKAIWWMGGEKVVKAWLEQNLVPVLHDMCVKGEIKDNYIIYIDTLVGTNELSYRLVKREDFLEDEVLKGLKKSSAELRVLYSKEKARINRIYLLKRKLYTLSPTASIDTGIGCIDGTIRELFNMINLMISEIHSNLVADEKKVATDKEKVVQRYVKEDAEFSLDEGGANKRAKKGLESLKARVEGLLGQATEVVARAALRIIDGSQYLSRVRVATFLGLPVATFLFLGLTASGKGKLIKELGKTFVADDGAKLSLEINLSAYGDSNSLLRLTDFLSGYTIREQHWEEEEGGNPFPDCMRMRPCSVLFLDQVEKAHISVFTALLSVLDCSMFIDPRGTSVGFWDTTVIITSDAGNKELFAHLAGSQIHGSSIKQQKQQEEEEVVVKGGFRHELLNRVDELVFLNPFAHDQLRKFATLSLLDGPNLYIKDLSTTLFSLFKTTKDDDSECHESNVVQKCVSKGLVVHA